MSSFSAQVGLPILLFESFDCFGTSKYFSGKKKKNLNEQKFVVGCCKLSLYANESCDEHAVCFR